MNGWVIFDAICGVLATQFCYGMASQRRSRGWLIMMYVVIVCAFLNINTDWK